MLAILPEDNAHILVKFYGFIENEITKALIIEYIPDGNLSEYIIKNKNPAPLTLYHIALDIACGLKYLHHNSIIHCDIKPENIMLASQRAKITDFGFSKTKTNNKYEKIVGTPSYIAPELILDTRKYIDYTEKTDVYSYGILLFVLYAQENPYSIEDPYKLMNQVAKKGLRPKIPSTVPQSTAALMKSSWMKNPIFRPSAKLIKQELKQIIKVEENNCNNSVGHINKQI